MRNLLDFTENIMKAIYRNKHVLQHSEKISQYGFPVSWNIYLKFNWTLTLLDAINVD